MSFNLRIPAGMDLLVRTRAEQVGISMNALILIALDQYMKSGQTPSMADLAPTPMAQPAVKVKRTLPTEPKLSSPPTKKELAAHHNWKREIDANHQRSLLDPNGKPTAAVSAWRGKGFVELCERRRNSDHPEAF